MVNIGAELPKLSQK